MSKSMLFRGDCLNILPRFIDWPEPVDLVLADLPYGTTRHKWDHTIDPVKLWPALRLVTKPNAAFLMFAQSPFDKILAVSNLRELKYEWIWEKSISTGFLNCKKAPLKNHETILCFYRSLPPYTPQFEKGTPYAVSESSRSNFSPTYGAQRPSAADNWGYRYPKTVLRFAVERGDHPTQKPVPLLEYLIKTYTKEGDTVLDPTMGSGSTGVACRRLNRNFIGIEKDREHFETAKRRIKETARK